MRISRFTAGLVAVGAAIALTACGGSDPQPQPQPQPIPSALQQAPLPQPEPQPGNSNDSGGNSSGGNVTDNQSGGNSSGETTIVYNGETLNCQLTFDLTGPCSALQQQFFDANGDSLDGFVNGISNEDLPDHLTFEDVAYATMTACFVGSFEEYLETLVVDGYDNYAGLSADRMYKLYQQAVYVYCDNDDAVENNT